MRSGPTADAGDIHDLERRCPNCAVPGASAAGPSMNARSLNISLILISHSATTGLFA
jgi:hypothetical protein